MIRLDRSAAYLSIVILAGCATTATQASPSPGATMGIASWYGEEFAGRATANGEIFDPNELTAAHRTLPFGTLIEVTNRANGKVVQVRINDRGPFIRNRTIDLSYAAARDLGLLNRGVATVEMRILELGDGRRYHSRARVARKEPKPEIVRDQGSPPPIAFPLPDTSASSEMMNRPTVAEDEDFRVDVIVEKGGVATRKQVSPDGRSVVDTPIPGEASGSPPATIPAPVSSTGTSTQAASTPTPVTSIPLPTSRQASVQKYTLQIGAFESRENAERLRARAELIIPSVFIDTAAGVSRVRIGPFSSRIEAIEAREKLEIAGLPTLMLID